MAQWNLSAAWSSGDLILTGTTSTRIVAYSEGTTSLDTLNMPPLRGRCDIYLSESSSGPYVAGYSSNPIGYPVWIENTVLEVLAVGASSNYITTEIGLGPTSSGSGGVLQDSAAGTTVGIMSGNTGGIVVKWMSTEYVVCLNEGVSSGSSGFRGTVTLFYMTCPVSSS